MSIVSNIFEVITSFLILAAVIYLVVLACIAVSCLVHCWVMNMLPSKKVWVVLPVGRNERLLMRMDKEIAEILVKCNEV